MPVIISLYMLLSLTCFFYWFSKNRQEGIYRLCVILFLPVLGYLLFVLLWFKKAYLGGCNNAEYLKPDGGDAEIVREGIKSPEGLRALSLVPIEEALLLNDNSIKRKLLLDILKGDIVKNAALLKLSLGNEDTETSHYAATGIVEIKRMLLQEVQECDSKYESMKNTAELVSYAYALKNYHGCGLLDETEGRKAKAIYHGVLKELLKVHSQEAEFFTDIINYEIEAGNFKLAGEYCKKFMAAFEQDEKPYLMYMKLYYRSRDRKGFEGMLRALKSSTISLSHNAWSIIKFWTEVYS